MTGRRRTPPRTFLAAALVVLVLGVVSMATARDGQRGALPTVSGPRETTSTTPTFRFSWRPRGVSAAAVRFQCAVDSTRLRPCPRTYRASVRPGTHVLRVRASAGSRRSGVRVFRFVVRGAPGPRVTATARIGGLPFGVALAGDSAFVTDFASGRLFRIDSVTGAIRWATNVGGEPGGLTVVGETIWVTSFERNELVQVSADGVAGRRVSVGPGPNAVAAGFGSLWVSNKGCNDAGSVCPGPGSITRVDAATGRVQATIPVGREPRYVTAADGAVWVTTFQDSRLTRIDPATSTVTREVAAPSGPNGVVSTGGSIWVAGYTGSVLWEYDAASLERRREVRLRQGAGPEGLSADRGVIWVADSSRGSVTRVSAADGRMLSTTPVGLEPRSVAAADGIAWVTNLRAGTVSRIAAP